ncbi:MAG: P-loop NTPase [Cyanobacteria bacterium SBLK]|nr:P-loop NTPase [Cyanobacteria bacterium SBLK]
MPKIVAIHSFRHGTGKSTLTANLMVSIARSGYRVGAIDADVELAERGKFPGIYSCFGLQKSQHLGDYLQGRATLAEIGQAIGEEIWHPSKTKDTTGSITLFSHDLSRQGRVNCPEFSDIKILSTLLDRIIADFNLDYLFLDIHPGLNETTLPLLALCDLLCLLLGLERADFQGTAVTLDIAKRLEIPQTFLLVNQVPADIDLTWFGEQVALAYDSTTVGVLPQIESLSANNPQKNIFALSDRDSHRASEFQKIVDRVIEEQEVLRVPRQERQPGAGLNLLDLLELPEAERHLFNSTLRQRSSTFEQILQQAELEPDTLRVLLDDLLARGLLKQVERNGKVYYRPYLTPKQGRKLNSRIWDALTERETKTNTD